MRIATESRWLPFAALFFALALFAPSIPIAANVATVETTAKPDNSTGQYYFTVRRDMRRCASPLCGGYFVKRVNQATTRCADGKNQSECYVTDIDWNSQPEIDPGKALLRGKIVIKGNRNGKFGVLRVTESWQAVGGSTAEGNFFRVRDRGLRCIAAPCESHHEEKLNTGVAREIAGVDIATANAGENADTQAFQAMTSSEGILVVGTHSPVSGPAGKSETLKASQYFLRAKPGLSQRPCKKTGCSGQVCSETEVITTCEYRPEYECYKKASCERQANGDCGFTKTPELSSCLAKK